MRPRGRRTCPAVSGGNWGIPAIASDRWDRLMNVPEDEHNNYDDDC